MKSRVRKVNPGAIPDLVRSGFVVLVLTIVFSALILGFAASVAEAALPSSKSLKTRDKYVRRLFDRAIDLFVAGEFGEAENALRDMEKETTLSERGHEIVSFMVGKCLYRQASFTLCRSHFEDFLREYPKSEYTSAALIYIGHCAYKLRETFAAARAYAAALAGGRESHRAIALANLEPLASHSLTPDELSLLGDVLGEDRNSGPAWLIIADRWRKSGKEQRAREIYRRLVRSMRRTDTGRTASERLKSLDAARARVLRVGVMAPLSGDFADYGRQLELAARLAQEMHPEDIRLFLVDTKADSELAEPLSDSLVELGCDLIVGPLVPDVITGASLRFAEYEVVQVLPLAHRGDFTPLSSTLFQMSVSPVRQGHLLARYAVDVMQLDLLAALAPDTPAGHQAAEAFADMVLAAGATMHPVRYYAHGDTDFGPQLRFIKKLSADDPWPEDEDGEPLELEDIIPNLDGMLLWGDPEDLELLVPQVVFHGFRVQYLGPASWGETEALRRIYSALDSVTFVSNEWVDKTRPEWRLFEDLYRARWEHEPTALAGRVFDVMTWLLPNSLPAEGPTSLYERLLSPKGFQGATGLWRFGEDRQPARLPLYKYRGGVPYHVDDL